MKLDVDGPKFVALRIAGAVAGALVLMLVLLAIVRPDMMSMAMVHTVMSAVGL
jgi:hypothetical protein